MYITGIVQNHKHKLLAINSMPDHIHIFIGYNVNQLITNLIEEIKTSSNSWIKKENFSKFRFEWQNGYGAFLHSNSQIDAVVRYIMNQELHHRKKSFREEYLEILKKNEIQYKDEYVFDFFDDGLSWEKTYQRTTPKQITSISGNIMLRRIPRLLSALIQAIIPTFPAK